MASSKRSKKFSAAMSWAFNRRLGAVFYLLALALVFSGSKARAESEIVSAVGSGKEVSDAMGAALRSVVSKHFKKDQAPGLQGILQSEIIPNASSFVQSYRLLDGKRGQSVAISANVDLSVIQALFDISPTGLGEPEGARA